MPMLKRLCRNKFFVKHRGSDGKLNNASSESFTNFNSESKIWTVKAISRLNAKEHKFDVYEKATDKTTNMSVYEYFQKKYNVYLNLPDLPLVQTQKANVVFPMELCVMCEGQRYPYKLNSDQVWLACTNTQEDPANILVRRPR